ncbi:MAG: hypothetical protein IT299_11110 [Dehalococcoidia bacterium]|nr:hypothetical protein [Dehalococcoidia bacterium]
MTAIGDAFVTLRPDASKFADETDGFFKANAGKFALVGAGVGLAIAGGFAALQLGETFDAAFDTIRRGTGATGEALQGLQADFKAVLKDVPTDAGLASTAIADLNTRLGLTGRPLQDLAKQELNFARITGTDVAQNITDSTRLFGDWSVATDHQSATLDQVFRAAQSTGIGVNNLMQKVVQFGAPLRQMGFGLDESLAMLGKWEKEGVNSELVLGSLRIAMGNFARDNIPMREGLDQTIRKIQELGPGAAATSLAMDTFGARAGPDMAAAILEGRFAIDEYLSAIRDGSDTINGAAADTDDWREKLTVLKNQALVALEPVLSGVFNGVGAIADAISTQLVPWMQEHVVPVVRDQLIPAFQQFVALVVPQLQRFADFAGEQFARFQVYYEQDIKPAVENIQKVIVWLVGEIEERWPLIEAIIRPVLEQVQIVVTTVFGIVTGIIDAVIQLLDGDFAGAWRAIEGVVASAMNGVQQTLQNALALVGGLVKTFFSVGVDLVQGLINGIKSMAGALLAAIRSTITDAMPGFVQNALGIQSPSRVFAGIGHHIVAGLAEGISDGASLATRAAQRIVDGVQAIAEPMPPVLAVPGRIDASTVRVQDGAPSVLGRQVEMLTGVVSQLVRGAGDLQIALSLAQPQQVTVRLGTDLALEGIP